MIGNDFSDFLLDIFGIAGLPSEPGQDLHGFVDIALLDEVSR